RKLGRGFSRDGNPGPAHRARKLHPDRMIRRIVCQSDRAAVSDIRGGIAQEEVDHLGRGQILDDIAHPRRGASVQERGRRWSEPELVTLLFKMAADRQVIAKYANATN